MCLTEHFFYTHCNHWDAEPETEHCLDHRRTGTCHLGNGRYNVVIDNKCDICSATPDDAGVNHAAGEAQSVSTHAIHALEPTRPATQTNTTAAPADLSAQFDSLAISGHNPGYSAGVPPAWNQLAFEIPPAARPLRPTSAPFRPQALSTPDHELSGEPSSFHNPWLSQTGRRHSNPSGPFSREAGQLATSNYPQLPVFDTDAANAAYMQGSLRSENDATMSEGFRFSLSPQNGQHFSRRGKRGGEKARNRAQQQL